jgi:hypothetical protein
MAHALLELARRTGAELTAGGAAGTELYEAFARISSPKPKGFVPWAKGRPFVWFEDDAEEKAAAAAWPASHPWSSGWTRSRA